MRYPNVEQSDAQKQRDEIRSANREINNLKCEIMKLNLC